MERQLPLLGRLAGQPITQSGSGQPPRVSPGDLIKADLVNSILDRLDASESRLNALDLVSGFMLGPLATGIHTLIAMSTGFEASGSSIWLDGNKILVGSRGINLVILSSLDLSVKFSNVYDTLVSTEASNQLVTDLQSQTSRYDVVVGVTQDAYLGGGFTTAAKNALAAVGGYSLSRAATTSRANAAFIGVVPANMSGVGFDYLTSVMPADGTGFDVAQLAALPFAWGLYSTSLQRFLLGGAANNSDTTGAVPVS